MNAPASLLRELPLAQPLERRRLQCYLALLLGDCAMVFAGYVAAGTLYLGAQGAGRAAVLAQLVLPLFLTIALYNGAYSIDALIRPRRGVLRALVAFALSAALVVAIAYYAKSSAAFSRVVFTGGFVLTALGLVWMRAQMRSFVRWRCGPRMVNELVILDGGPTLELPGAVHIEAASYGIVAALDNPAALDRLGALLQSVDRVVVSCPPPRRLVWSFILKGANVDGEVIDDSVVELGAHGARIAGSHGFLRVSLGPLGLRARVAKRLFDVTIAGAAVIVLSPLLAVVALAILLQDGAPVLFRQRRVGRGNRFFDVYKFRSMRTAASDHAGNRSTGRDDDRITPIGRLIRRTSIDELPQLFNVLSGEMSSVIRKLAQHPVDCLAGAELCGVRSRQSYGGVTRRHIGNQRQRNHGRRAGRAKDDAAAAVLPRQLRPAEIVNRVAGKDKGGLGSTYYARFRCGHRFHAITRLGEADALGTDRRRVSSRRADRWPVIYDPVAPCA